MNQIKKVFDQIDAERAAKLPGDAPKVEEGPTEIEGMPILQEIASKIAAIGSETAWLSKGPRSKEWFIEQTALYLSLALRPYFRPASQAPPTKEARQAAERFLMKELGFAFLAQNNALTVTIFQPKFRIASLHQLDNKWDVVYLMDKAWELLIKQQMQLLATPASTARTDANRYWDIFTADDGGRLVRLCWKKNDAGNFMAMEVAELVTWNAAAEQKEAEEFLLNALNVAERVAPARTDGKCLDCERLTTELEQAMGRNIEYLAAKGIAETELQARTDALLEIRKQIEQIPYEHRTAMEEHIEKLAGTVLDAAPGSVPQAPKDECLADIGRKIYGVDFAANLKRADAAQAEPPKEEKP